MNSNFSKIAQKILDENNSNPTCFERTQLVVVHHLLSTHIPFFSILLNLFDKVTFISIPYSETQIAVDYLKSKKTELILTNSIVDLETKLEGIIINLVKNNQKFILIEVGGYGCKILNILRNELKNLLIGVIEDTENGHRIYESTYMSFLPTWKTYSVARSTLKISEDILTGDSIVFSVEKIIRSLNKTLVSKNILVLGYGKIGKSVCLALKGRKSNVSVFDCNPIRVIEAKSNGFLINSLEKLLPTADIVIGVSGYTSLSQEEFRQLKEGVFLFSGSSKQIEFDINYIKSNYTISDTELSELKLIKTCDEKWFYLANNGEPVNFIDKGIVGSFIELVWAEIIKILTIISQNQTNKIYELNEEDRKKIANYWLEVYSDFYQAE